MTVIRCRRASLPTLNLDKRARGTYEAVWHVQTDDPMDGPVTVLTEAQALASSERVPALWSTYAFHDEQDIASFLRSFRVEPREDPHNSKTLWRVIAHYEPLEPQEQEGDGDTDPLQRPVRYRLEHTSYTRVVEQDNEGNAIVNACEQEFDEPIEDEQSRIILVAEKNFASLQEIINLNLTYAGKVNNDSYRGAGERMWYCHTIGCSDLQTEGNVSFYTATFRLELNFETWDRKVLNRGFKHYDDSNKLVQATDTAGIPCNEPILLDEDGTRLADGATGNFITFKVKKEVAFSGLGV